MKIYIFEKWADGERAVLIRPGKPYNDDYKRFVVAFCREYRDSMSERKIARELEIPRSTMRRWVKPKHKK